MITVCQAHLPQAFRALSTGPSSSFFIGDLNKWGCQLSEQQLEETGLLWIQGWITSVYNGFFSHIIHIKKKKNYWSRWDVFLGIKCYQKYEGTQVKGSERGSLATCSTIRSAAWRRKWQSTPVFLPGESHRQRNLAGSWVSKSGMTQWVNNSYIKFHQPVKRKERSATLFDICPFCSHYDAW